VVERGIPEQEQLRARAFAEASDNVVEAVDLDCRAKLFEGGRRNLSREVREPGSSGSTRFPPSGTSVSAATNLSNQPQSRSTSIETLTRRTRG
jgi:hypothetical protein